MLDRLRTFLREHDLADFTDGADFAEQLLGELEKQFGNGWSSQRATHAIDRTTRGIYEYYRLRDVTVFGDGDPIGLTLGGPDKVSIKFIGKLDHFYFSKFADNTREPMRKFFTDRFFGDGGLLFDEHSDAWREFQQAGGDRFKNLTYRQTKTIIDTAVSRTRVWAHIGSLAQVEGAFEYARLVATLDARTSELCRFIDGKLVPVGVAQDAIERLTKLTPAKFAKQLYGGDEDSLNKQLVADPVGTMEKYLESDGKTFNEEITRAGRSFPPFHPNCRTRLEGVVAGVEDSEQ